MVRDSDWPIVVLLEFEHGTLRTGVAETQLMFDYCKRALACVASATLVPNDLIH